MPAPLKGIVSKISKKEMKEAIKASGYLLEQRVEPILTEAGFYVQMNAAYADPETGKSRELDISAISAISVFKFLRKNLFSQCFFANVKIILNPLYSFLRNRQYHSYITTRLRFLESRLSFGIKVLRGT